MYFLKSTLSYFAVFSILALAGCSAKAQTSAQAPLVRIGQTTAAPVIDGKLDDAAWKQSIAVGDFSITGSKIPASEATQVRFVYDAHNLYVAWRMQESLLVVAQQRMHEVRINARKHDDDVLSDDSVELFLQPGDNAKMREFDINSIGTLFDAQSEKGDLWKTRDASWNSDAKVAGVQEDGYWSAELAIPWKAFGLNSAPANGASWTLGLARHATGRGESSSWNQNDAASIHLMNNFGTLIFDSQVPAITPQPIASFEAGKSTFTVQTSQALDINVDLIGDKKTQQFMGKTVSPDSTIVVPISTPDAKVLFQWSAKEGEKYFYRSPQLSLNAQSSLAHLKISTTAPWKLFVNGTQTIDGKAAQNQDVTFPLADGINDIVIEAQSGQAKLQLTPPGFGPDEKVTWRTHAVDPKVLSETDRRSWKIAPESDGEIGTTGAPALLQHTLLNKSTLSYPVESPAFYIAQGTAQQITFLAEGVAGIRFNNWQMSLAVPSQFEVLGSSGFYGEHIKGKPKFTSTKIGPTTIDGKAMMLYHIDADNPIIYQANKQTILASFEVLVRLPKTTKVDFNQQWNLYYWTQGNDGAVSEAPQSIALRALPALNGKQPKKFVWEFWSGGTHVYDDQRLVNEILDTSRQAGFNKYQASSQKDFNDKVRSYGLDPFLTIHFKDGRTMDITKPYLAQHPDEGLVDKNGKLSDSYMCTTELLGKNWPMFEKSIEDITKSSGAAAIEYDYEYPPFNPPHACFDARCLAAFRAFSKIDDSVELTPAIVQKDYPKQWVDFMAYRTAILLKKMKDAVHAANSKVLFTAYSGYYNAKDDTTKTRYGIDWNLVGEMQSVDQAGMGYGRPADSIDDSIKALRGIPVKFGELLVPYDKHSRQPVAPMLKSTLLRRALDATGGVLIYTRASMDGRSWTAVADVSRLTADYEDVFLNKTSVDLPGQDAANVQIAKGAKHTLLCVMNPSRSKESTFALQVPEGLGNGKEYYTGETIKSGQKLQIKLAPGDAKVFLFGD